MKSIRLVHYWCYQIRGGEHVLRSINNTFELKTAHILFGDSSCSSVLFPNVPVHFSPFNSLPGAANYYRNLLPLYPVISRSLKVPKADVIISSESGPAKASVQKDSGFHVCYCHTPMRYIWSHTDEYLRGMSIIKKMVFRLCLPYLRWWDRKSADNVDVFIANSHTVKERIELFYQREAEVIHPPVRYNLFSISPQKKDYYFVLSALVPYKRIDLAVEAFSRLGVKLKIAGVGPELNKLRSISNDNIEFLGRVSDEEVARLYASAKAFIFPGEEDFGITPLEAQASGTPVIAYRKGGATETVKDRYTGVFFDEQSAEALMMAVRRFEQYGVGYSAEKIRTSVESFSEQAFEQKMGEFVNVSYEHWCNAK